MGYELARHLKCSATRDGLRLGQGVSFRPQPPLDALLNKAAGEGVSRAVQTHALSFLASRVDSYDYQPTIAKRIVPTAMGEYAVPCECYMERTAWPAVFHTAHPSLSPSTREALRLPLRPPIQAVLSQLLARPPCEDASEVFAYLHARSDEIEAAEWERLASAPFVPLRRAEPHGVTHVAPLELFFGGCKKKFGRLLDYTEIKPSSPAGTFLASCGVSEAPSVLALARCVAVNHTRTLKPTGSSPSSYLSALRELARGLHDKRGYGFALPAELREALSEAACLVGLHGGGWRPVRAAECFIADHPAWVRTFDPLLAPESGELKQLYAYLGSSTLSQAVSVVDTPHPSPAGGGGSRLSRMVRARISERACLLLHDIDQPSCPPRHNLKPSAAEMLRSERMSVCEVSSHPPALKGEAPAGCLSAMPS